MDNKVIVILGMGRSGTSFVSSWLQACGLNMGENFLKPNFMNIKGFFEDVRVLKFQDGILRRHGMKNIFRIKLNKNLILNDKDYEEAKNIIVEKNKQYNQWGWKDPRTCLFAETLWNELLPEAKIVVVYRPYWQVVDSIYRAEIKNQFKRRNKVFGIFRLLKHYLDIGTKKYYNTYLETWVRYNQDILSFIAKKNPKDICVINVEELILNSENIYDTLTERLRISINYTNPKNLFDERLFQKANKSKIIFSKELSFKADELLKKLDSYSTN